ncbi:MAG: hypothetical protein QOJ98_2804, partial [Acidobacteriota bacterium]|nr:hypothetical protein [Acidobacteriota bacterium]
GWGLPLRYQSWPAGPADSHGGYVVISTGADGKLDANSRAFLQLAQAQPTVREVAEFLARATNEENARPKRRVWAESFDDDIICVSGSFAYDHPRRIGVTSDAPSSVVRQGWLIAASFMALFLALTIHDYRRSRASW